MQINYKKLLQFLSQIDFISSTSFRIVNPHRLQTEVIFEVC